MKKILIAVIILTTASTAAAQSMITPTPRGGSSSSMDGFRIGPRLSSYSTDLDIDIFTIESGRQMGFGLVGDYRAGAFLIDFNYDHDPENGLQISDFLPIEFGQYSRDRAEASVGWAAIPYLDLQGGVRMDKISIGGNAIGGGLFDGEDFDYQAIFGGVRVHSATNRPFGVYGVLRGYSGTVDFGGFGLNAQADMTGWRAEGGFIIPIGESQWSAVPGLEYEYLDAESTIKLETNRVFVNFVYQFPR